MFFIIHVNPFCNEGTCKMFVNWLRNSVYSSGVLLLFRLYLGYHWMTAGWGKLTSEKGFTALGFLKGAIGKATGEHPAVQSWWAAFLKNFAIPNVELFNFLVPWGEFLVGIGLLLGVVTTFSAFMGATMNFAFMFSGSTSTNVQMVLLTIFILVAGRNAGRFGLDYYLHSYIDKVFKSKSKNTGEATYNA